MEHQNVDELLREFVIESNERLETIDRDLMVLRIVSAPRSHTAPAEATRGAPR